MLTIYFSFRSTEVEQKPTTAGLAFQTPQSLAQKEVQSRHARKNHRPKRPFSLRGGALVRADRRPSNRFMLPAALLRHRRPNRKLPAAELQQRRLHTRQLAPRRQHGAGSGRGGLQMAETRAGAAAQRRNETAAAQSSPAPFARGSAEPRSRGTRLLERAEGSR